MDPPILQVARRATSRTLPRESATMFGVHLEERVDRDGFTLFRPRLSGMVGAPPPATPYGAQALSAPTKTCTPKVSGSMRSVPDATSTRMPVTTSTSVAGAVAGSAT